MCNTAQSADLSMMTELYEFTLADGYFSAGMQDTVACFDLFFRRVPDGGGFAVMAGLEQVIAYLKNLHFTEGDLAFLREKGISEPFLQYLRDFKFACDVWAIPEGTPIFPNEPIVKVRGPVVQAQMIETMLLLCINQQSLIATKANRLVRAAHGAHRARILRSAAHARRISAGVWRPRAWKRHGISVFRLCKR